MVFHERNINPPRVSLNLVHSNTLGSSPISFYSICFLVLLLLLLDSLWKRGESAKSSWTGFVWFYRVSLRLIEFYIEPPSFSFVRPGRDSILRDFSRPVVAARCDRHFAVARKNRDGEQIRMMRFYTNRRSQFVTSTRRCCNSAVGLLLLPTQ